MAVEAFIKFVGSQNPIKGESQDLKLKGSDGWSNLQNIRFGASNKVSAGSGGADAPGKPVFEEVEITKLVDSASPKFFATLCSGGHFDSVSVAIRNAGGPGEPGEPFLEYKFAAVFVIDIRTSVGDGAEGPTETVKFAYGAAQISYRSLDPQGKLAAPSTQAWSRILNKPTIAVG